MYILYYTKERKVSCFIDDFDNFVSFTCAVVNSAISIFHLSLLS
jgi:hypothetical protein